MLLEDPQAIAHRYRRVVDLLLVLLLVNRIPASRSYNRMHILVRQSAQTFASAVTAQPMIR